MPQTDQYKARLTARLAELNTRLATLEDALDDLPDPDAGERATEREADEVLEGLGTAGQAEIRKIEAALARIADGSFGICVNCGKAISHERLEVIPHAARCRTCA